MNGFLDLNRIIDGAIEEKEIKVGKEIYMRKIIICIIAVIAVSLIGTTTILAANMGSNEAVRITQTTEIPLIKSTDKITVIQEPNKTEAADNEEVEEEIETTVTSDTDTKPTTETKTQTQTTTQPETPTCEYCGYAHGHYYEDLNGDGICDHYNGSTHHYDENGYHCQGYADVDNDGICDRYGNNNNGYGQGHHQGNGHRRGHHR